MTPALPHRGQPRASALGLGVRLLVLCVVSAVSYRSSAQAKPSYTQYILNNFVLNPAVAGIENYTDIRFSYRNQWTGINGAPKTTYLTLHAPLGKQDDGGSPTSFERKGVNPRGPGYWSQYSAPPAHHGVGMVMINDKAGYINRWSIYGCYAYHRPLGPKTTLSAGFSGGLSSVNLDRSQINFGNLDPNDPAIGYANNELNKVRPELGAGLWLYSSRYFLGLSVLNVIPAKNRFVNNEKYGVFYTPNFFMTAGYRFNLGESFNVIPSLMYQYWEPQLSGLHLNLKCQYNDLLWAGAGYRISDLISGYTAMVGMNISNTLNVGYAYEMSSTSRLRNYTGNTHEILIGVILGNRYGDSCPKNVW